MMPGLVLLHKDIEMLPQLLDVFPADILGDPFQDLGVLRLPAYRSDVILVAGKHPRVREIILLFHLPFQFHQDPRQRPEAVEPAAQSQMQFHLVLPHQIQIDIIRDQHIIAVRILEQQQRLPGIEIQIIEGSVQLFLQFVLQIILDDIEKSLIRLDQDRASPTLPVLQVELLCGFVQNLLGIVIQVLKQVIILKGVCLRMAFLAFILILVQPAFHTFHPADKNFFRNRKPHIFLYAVLFRTGGISVIRMTRHNGDLQIGKFTPCDPHQLDRLLHLGMQPQKQYIDPFGVQKLMRGLGVRRFVDPVFRRHLLQIISQLLPDLLVLIRNQYTIHGLLLLSRSSGYSKPGVKWFIFYKAKRSIRPSPVILPSAY